MPPIASNSASRPRLWSRSNAVQQVLEFNLFTGMAHNYDPAFEVDTNKFNLLTKHLLEVWCGGNKDHYNWLLSWLANIIQSPQQKIGIAVVLHSEAEGAGKGIIVDWFGKEVILAESTTLRLMR